MTTKLHIITVTGYGEKMEQAVPMAQQRLDEKMDELSANVRIISISNTHAIGYGLHWYTMSVALEETVN